MKETIKTDKNNQALICEVLQLSELDYKVIRMEAMHNYAKNYSGQFGKEIEDDFLDALLNSNTFENWFKNQFNRKNWLFVHRYCLRTFSRRVRARRAVRANKKKLIANYLREVQIKADQLYPDQELMRIILKETSKK